MFKKISTYLLWVIICALPVLGILTLGFPIKGGPIGFTARCYMIGNLQIYTSCFDDHQTHILRGVEMIRYIFHAMNDFIYPLGVPIGVLLIILFMIMPLIIFWLERTSRDAD